MLAPVHIRPFLTAALAALFAIAALVGPAGVAAAAGDDSLGFGVEPMRFDIETRAGDSSTHTISITNTESTATKFTFSKEDFQGDQSDPGATPVLLGGKFASDISGYDWIALPGAITVPAGQTRSVPIKVTVPAGATGGHYTALMVHGESRRAGNLVAQSRLGVLFLMNAGGALPPEIVITEVREVGPTRTVTEFINKGTTAITNPKGTIRRDPVGPGDPTKVTGECRPRTVLPGAAGECTFEDAKAGTGTKRGSDGSFGGIGPVEQYVDIVGDPGEEGTSARGQLPTEWAGTWTSMLLPLVGVVLFVLYFLFLRRRRKQEEDGDVDLAWGAPT